ncbi:hypothetical protein [Saccharopolyspora flava]|uniref:hypothetical protein n=1 Tax=Saccharopolyspora flava TaxID=95161 RepID=UPI00111504FB|nr:hypothetical protein [Saccharopolyspora flava]
MSDVLAWLSLLPEAARLEFEADYARALASGDDDEIAQTFYGWRSTAFACADPELVEHLSEPLVGDHGPVPPPRNLTTG